MEDAQKWEYLSGAGGQIAGILKELKPAAQVVEEMVRDAIRVLEERLPPLVGGEGRQAVSVPGVPPHGT